MTSFSETARSVSVLDKGQRLFVGRRAANDTHAAEVRRLIGVWLARL